MTFINDEVLLQVLLSQNTSSGINQPVAPQANAKECFRHWVMICKFMKSCNKNSQRNAPKEQGIISHKKNGEAKDESEVSYFSPPFPWQRRKRLWGSFHEKSLLKAVTIQAGTETQSAQILLDGFSDRNVPKKPPSQPKAFRDRRRQSVSDFRHIHLSNSPPLAQVDDRIIKVEWVIGD
eukprot:766764-Hanusia_phi.AAC.10